MSTKYKEELVKKDIEEITSDDDATSQCKLELYKTILHKGDNINIKLTGRNIKLKKSSSYQKICAMSSLYQEESIVFTYTSKNAKTPQK